MFLMWLVCTTASLAVRLSGSRVRDSCGEHMSSKNATQRPERL
jgi:hypothetical protein